MKKKIFSLFLALTLVINLGGIGVPETAQAASASVRDSKTTTGFESSTTGYSARGGGFGRDTFGRNHRGGAERSVRYGEPGCLSYRACHLRQ